MFPGGDLNVGCTLLGGAIKHGVSSADAGATLLDVPCVVDPDPRMATGICSGADLPVASLCPGFGNTVIPGHLCGRGGASGRGFALVKTVETGGAAQAPGGLLVTAEVSADNILGTPNPACPALTADWAPLSTNGEGTIVEAPYLTELTGFCGTSRILPPGKSLIGIGLQINLNALPGATQTAKLENFANQKLDNLTATVTAATNMTDPGKTDLLSCVAKAKTYLNDTTLTPDSTRYACAANKAWTCDNAVSTSSFGANPGKLSAYSAIRGRLANIILTIDTRLNGHTASQVWPLPQPALPATSCDPDTTAPTVPAGLAASSVTGSGLRLDWNASTDPGANSTGVGGYRVFRGNTQVGNTADTFFVDSSLNEFTSYDYSVRAYDKAPVPGPNVSDPSGTLTVKTLDTLPPTIPGGLAASNVTAHSVQLDWSASSDTGSGVSGYRVFRGATQVGDTTATTFPDSPPDDFTTYSYTVRAYDKVTPTANVSDPSAPVSVTTLDGTAPSVPAGLAASSITGNSVRLDWSASTDAGTGVGGYKVYRDNAPVGDTTALFFVDSPPSEFTTYSYTVAAFDTAPAVNQSLQSSPPLSVKTLDTKAPDVPVGLVVSNLTASSLTLSWTASGDPTPGSGTGGYNVYRNNSLVQSPVTTGTSINEVGLTGDTTYGYQVEAFDKRTPTANTSALSGSVSAKTLIPPDLQDPSTPTGLATTSVKYNSVALKWNASTDPQPFPSGIGGYRVYRNGVAIATTTGTGTTYTDSGALPQKTYSYQVAAYDKSTANADTGPNGSNISAASPGLSVTTPCYDPDNDHDCHKYP